MPVRLWASSFLVVLLVTAGTGATAAPAITGSQAGPEVREAGRAAAAEAVPVVKPVCLVLPLTGPHGALGERVAREVERVLGAAGIPVRRLDDRGDAAGVAEAVAKVDQEGCVALIGGLGDEEARLLADAASRQDVPLLALGAAPDGRKRPGVTWARTPRSEPIAALARRLAGSEGVKVAYLLAPGTRYGRTSAEAFRAAFEAAGGRVAVVRVLGPEDGDPRVTGKGFGAQVHEARAAGPCGPEVLFLPMDADGARRWLGFLEAEGVVGTPQNSRCPLPVVAGTSLWADGAQLARSGAALEGGRFGDVRTTGEPAASVLEAEAADAARLLVAALQAAPTRSRRDVIDALETGAGVEGLTGTLKAERGRVTGRDVTTWTLRAGRPVPDADPLEGGAARP
jgi:ABC-type branched-subunit amino acid transport system substrate-binding protein